MVSRIQSIHFDADSKLIQFIENKMNELDRYLSRVNTGQAEVILKLQPGGIIQEKFVELIIRVAGVPIAVTSSDKRFEDAFVKAHHLLKRSILRHKEKLQNKH